MNKILLLTITIILLNLTQQSEKITMKELSNHEIYNMKDEHHAKFLTSIPISLENIQATSTNATNASSAKKIKGFINPVGIATCYWVQKDFNVFDISGLRNRNETDLNIKLPDGNNIYYNFCDNTKYKCAEVTSQMVWVNKNYANADCKILAKGIEETNKFSLLDPENANKGIKIELRSGQVCDAVNSVAYTTTLEITCDNELESGKLNFDPESIKAFNKDTCLNTLKATSKSGCPALNLFVISKFMEDYKWAVGAILIIVGIFLLIFGVKFFKTTFYLVIVVIITTFLLIVISFFRVPSYSVWICIGVAVIAGIPICYFIWHLEKLLAAGLGGYLGYTLGVICYNAFFRLINYNPEVVYWCTVIGFIILGVILALCINNIMFIISTAIIGGYATVRGASLYIGYFPSESVIIDLIEKEEWDELADLTTWPVWIYFSVWIILSILGMVFQYKKNHHKTDNNDYHRIHDDNKDNQ